MSEEKDVREEAEKEEVASPKLPTDERLENLEKDVLDLMEEREDLFAEIKGIKDELGRLGKLLGSAGSAVKTKDDKSMNDVAKQFKR